MTSEQSKGDGGEKKAEDSGAEQGKKSSSLRRLLEGMSDLAAYTAREQATWATESKNVQSLAWLLRMKHAEARSRGLRAGWMAAILTVSGAIIIGASARITYLGWCKILELAPPVAQKAVASETGTAVQAAIPQGTWQLALSTTGAALLIFACGAMLFRVAGTYYQRSLIHAAETAATRNIEAAVRMTLAAESTDAATAWCKLGERLLERSVPSAQKEHEEDSVELSVLSPLLKELRELVAVVAKLVSTTRGGPGEES